MPIAKDGALLFNLEFVDQLSGGFMRTLCIDLEHNGETHMKMSILRRNTMLSEVIKGKSRYDCSW